MRSSAFTSTHDQHPSAAASVFHTHISYTSSKLCVCVQYIHTLYIHWLYTVHNDADEQKKKKHERREEKKLYRFICAMMYRRLWSIYRLCTHRVRPPTPHCTFFSLFLLFHFGIRKECNQHSGGWKWEWNRNPSIVWQSKYYNIYQ